MEIDILIKHSVVFTIWYLTHIEQPLYSIHRRNSVFMHWCYGPLKHHILFPNPSLTQMVSVFHTCQKCVPPRLLNRNSLEILYVENLTPVYKSRNMYFTCQQKLMVKFSTLFIKNDTAFMYFYALLKYFKVQWNLCCKTAPWGRPKWS